MAEKKTDDAAAGLDAAAVQKLIADAIKPLTEALAESQKNQKVIADTMAADAKAKTEAADAAKAAEAAKGKDAGKDAAGKDAAAAPLTAEAIAKLTSDAIAKALSARDEAAKSGEERQKFIAEKLKGVPSAYHARLGADPAKWAAEEQAIREGLKTDLAALGVKVPEVKGGEGGGATTSSDTAKTAQQRVADYKAAGLSDGAAEFAQQIVLPN